MGDAACEPLDGGAEDASADSDAATTADGTTATGLVSVDAQALCTRLTGECAQPITMTECLATYRIVRVTPACGANLAAATCAELASNDSAIFAACFPACAGVVATCRGDGTLTQCTDQGRARVVDCQGLCVSQGYTSFTGVCGTTFDASVADSDQCWCQ